MSLINTGCILKKADSDVYVKYQDSVLEVKRERLGITLSPGPRVIYGTRSLSVSGVLLERVSCPSKINSTKSWPTTQMYPGAVSLDTHMTVISASQILCATTIEIGGLAL